MRNLVFKKSFIVILILLVDLFPDLYAINVDEILNATGIKGGIIAHINCKDGKLTSGLWKNDKFIVHGLDTDIKNVQKARDYIHSKGLYGPVSIALYNGKQLPYTDNLINLIVAEDPGKVKMQEVMRVLVPNGKAYIKEKGKWRKHEKPRPDSIDEWTHFLHGPDNNAVANDTIVALPRSLQWTGPPAFGRSHEELTSISALVSSGGRVFYISDEAPAETLRFPSEWKLVAQDAFNGKILWKKPISVWIDHLRKFRAGPAHLPRRLVAVDETVYVTLGLDAPVTALDAATGEVIKTYPQTQYTEEIIYNRGKIYLVVGTSEKQVYGKRLFKRGEPKPSPKREILVFEAGSGKKIWEYIDPDKDFIIPLSLGVKGDKVVFKTTTGIVCLNSKNGKKIWKAERKSPLYRYAWSVPTVVLHDKVVLVADRDLDAIKDTEMQGDKSQIKWSVTSFSVTEIEWNGKEIKRKGKNVLKAYSMQDGKELWSVKCGEGYNSPVDVFIVDDLVWTGPSFSVGYDIVTGEEKKPIPTKGDPVGMAHARCYRNKASKNYIYICRHGIDVIDLDKGWDCNNGWVRGNCQYGIMPANGFIYAPPDACACALLAKVQGFNVIGPQRSDVWKKKPDNTLEKGPAYNKIRDKDSSDHDWPAYRYNVFRSQASSVKIPKTVKNKWKIKIGGRLTQPVIGDNKVFIASIDEHTLYALDTGNGKKIWQYIAGGRIDSSPALYKGRVLFGCRDGWVYCLDMENGDLTWRFRAAPEDRLIGAHDQIESAWPVHGAVLLQNEALYCTAGRSSYLDGGIHFIKIDPVKGTKLADTLISSLDAINGKQLTPDIKGSFNTSGILNDILSGDGETVFVKHMRFDNDLKPKAEKKFHIFTPTGFLDDNFFIRSYWQRGTDLFHGFTGWARMGRMVPSGRILCADDKNVYGYGRKETQGGMIGHKANDYHLFSDLKKVERLDNKQPDPKKQSMGKKKKQRKPKTKRSPQYKKTNNWSIGIPVTVKAMVLTGDQLIVAGPPDVAEKTHKILSFENPDKVMAAYKGELGGLLCFISGADGKKLGEYKINAPPVFDGMSAANGNLFISLKNGEIVCLGE